MESPTTKEFHVIINVPHPRPQRAKSPTWNQQSDARLLHLVQEWEKFDDVDWFLVSSEMNVSIADCQKRFGSLMHQQLQMGAPAPRLNQPPSAMLKQCVLNNDFNWEKIGAELNMNTQQCRELYLNNRTISTPWFENMTQTPDIKQTETVQKLPLDLEEEWSDFEDSNSDFCALSAQEKEQGSSSFTQSALQDALQDMDI